MDVGQIGGGGGVGESTFFPIGFEVTQSGSLPKKCDVIGGNESVLLCIDYLVLGGV